MNRQKNVSHILEVFGITDEHHEKIVDEILTTALAEWNGDYNVDVYFDIESHEITTLNHFGNTWIDSNSKYAVLCLKPEAYREYETSMHEGLTEEEIEYCHKNNWLTMYEHDKSEFKIEEDEDLKENLRLEIDNRLVEIYTEES